MDTVYHDLKQAGVRPSSSRIAILTLFHNFPEDHLTVEQIFRKLSPEGICSLSSVYRALAQLTTAGLIRCTVIGEARVIYELNRRGPHHHIVCDTCGCINDIFETSLSKQCEEIALQHRFIYSDANLTVFGRCETCEKTKSTHLHH
jgi:Fur family ferric uptake transcriptional regulator